jgi:hypothetical protein
MSVRSARPTRNERRTRAYAMKTLKSSTTNSVDANWKAAIHILAWLHAKAVLGIDVSRDLCEFHSRLQSLPLATAEFGLAKNRLNNAIRYFGVNERGAARFELSLLERSLRYWADGPYMKPHVDAVEEGAPKCAEFR